MARFRNAMTTTLSFSLVCFFVLPIAVEAQSRDESKDKSSARQAQTNRAQQDRGRQSRGRQDRTRPVGSGLPKVGSTLPEVNAYDESGKRFSTKSLRGHYTVLVFGCLT